MLFSVWDTSTRQYHYYETPVVGPTHAPPASHVSSSHALGATPAEAAWPLPPGARKVGAGAVARGRIASTKPFGAALGSTSMGASRTGWIVGGLVAAALLARRYLR